MTSLRPFRTLQGRFTVLLSLLILLMMGVLAYWNISRESRLMEEALLREGKALAESFAISCTNTLLYEEIGLVEEGGLLDNFIADLMARKDLNIVYAMLLDPKGNVIAHHKPTEVGALYEDAVTRSALASWHTLVQNPSPAVFDIATPLAISTKRWGTLKIGISTEPLKRELSKLIFRYVLYAGGLVMGLIGAIAFLFGLITKPLKSLSKEMDSLTIREDLITAPPVREDEVGVLQRSFYRMVRRIQEDEKERERMIENLHRTEKMVAIGKLATGMAHEINNPLGGLLNCLYHFKKGTVPRGKEREYLDLMEEGIRRIQRVVSNLLEYARNPKLEAAPTDLGSLIERSLALLDYPIRKGRIKIEKSLPEDGIVVEVDKDQMGQVLVNVFLNAIQAMPEGGILGVRAEVLAEEVHITISDTGKGISKEVLPRVFDPFFTTKGQEKGTGLGLWLSQGIVERHGGTIHLSSDLGKGSVVRIRLPLRSKTKEV